MHRCSLNTPPENALKELGVSIGFSSSSFLKYGSRLRSMSFPWVSDSEDGSPLILLCRRLRTALGVIVSRQFGYTNSGVKDAWLLPVRQEVDMASPRGSTKSGTEFHTIFSWTTALNTCITRLNSLPLPLFDSVTIINVSTDPLAKLPS